ncbi:MAG TPA: DCC1-like thiol-disulfide oxidoreductase family protein [Myxococcaceae bacterium]|nr:DCC1-like thiol-disulfide oxidoreductase family protein [Myxococcaceae bacterium]
MRGAHAQAATAWQIEGMPIAKPLLIFDGECTFCRRSAKRFRVMTEGRVDTRASQEVDLEALGVEPEWVKRSVVFVDPESTHTEGSEAIFRALLHSPRRRIRWGARAGLVPGVLGISQIGYRWVARNRALASRIERAILKPPVEPNETS